jgi:hypothetical protein
MLASSSQGCMLRLSRQYVRAVIFLLMVLVTAGINPVCLVDDDGDDETPAVTIELNAVLPNTRAVHHPNSQASGWIKTNSYGPRKLSASFTSPIAHAPESSALPLIVPLRT